MLPGMEPPSYNKRTVPQLHYLGQIKEKIDEKLGSFRNSLYLCTVRMKGLTIRAESREGRTILTPP